MGKKLQILQDNEVKKHVATIHCANTLSLLQRKISNVLLYHAYPTLNVAEEHTITVKQLCQLIDYHGNNHAVIKKAIKGLITTLVEWDIVDDSTHEEDWTASTLLASVRIKGTHCTYAYSPRMRELLYLPAMYGKINLVIQAKFNSGYGLALYENCIRYRGLSYTKWFHLPLFRKLMGVSENTYEIFRDFKRRILDKAVSEVNEYSDLLIQPEIERAGHKVVAIRFKLALKKGFSISGDSRSVAPKSIPLNHQPQTVPQQLLETLTRDFELKYEIADQLLEAYEIDYLEEKIQWVSFLKKRGEKILNPAGYLLKALKENYQVPFSLTAVQKHKVVSEGEGAQAIASTEASGQTSAYAKYKASVIDSHLANLDTTLLADINNAFATYLQNEYGTHSHIFIQYQKNGLQHKTVATFYRHFVIQHYAHLLPSFLSLEEFSQQQAIDTENYSFSSTAE